MKIFLIYTKFSKWNKAKQVFPTNIFSVEGAKMIAVLLEKKKKKNERIKKKLVGQKIFNWW